MTAGKIGQRKCIEMPIVNVSSPLGRSQPGEISLRMSAEQLADPLVLLHRRLEARSVCEAATRRVVGQEVDTVKDGVQLDGNDGYHQVAEVNGRVGRLSAGDHHLISLIVSL